MNKLSKALVLSALAGAPLLAASVASAADAPTPEHSITGNLGLFSSYRFRGIDQTFGKPAVQGGFDYSHKSGLYLGNWNSNVSEGAGYPGGNLEMDFYGGYKASFGDVGVDAGFLYYYYPGTDSAPGLIGAPANNVTGAVHSGRVDNKEVYVGASWKFLSLKYSHATDDYFSVPGTKNSNYLDLGASYDLGNGWGVNAHVGHLKLKNIANGDYTDWKLGVTKDIAGYVVAVSYIDTNAKGDCSPTAVNQFYCLANSSGTKFKDGGRSTGVISVSKTF